ncbi:unnamed protein product, partial [marine sediment metagenome]
PQFTNLRVAQTIKSWSDTLIEFDVVQGTLYLNPTTLFVTNSEGGREKFDFTLNHQPFPVIPSTLSFQHDDVSVKIAGFNFLASQGIGKVEISNNQTYGAGTVVEQTSINSWTDNEVDFNWDDTGLEGQTFLFVWVTNNLSLKNLSPQNVHVFQP